MNPILQYPLQMLVAVLMWDNRTLQDHNLHWSVRVALIFSAPFLGTAKAFLS